MFMFIRNDFLIDKVSADKVMWICWKYLTIPITVAFRKALLTSDSDPIGSDLEDFGHLTHIKKLDKSSHYYKPFKEPTEHLKG